MVMDSRTSDALSGSFDSLLSIKPSASPRTNNAAAIIPSAKMEIPRWALISTKILLINLWPK